MVTMNVPADLYPFQGKTLDRAGLAYHYLDEGQGDPVVMVHGNPTWSFYFRDLVLDLRRDHRCIVPDHIGMGLSEKPGDDRYRYTLASRIDDLTALLQRLNLNRPLTLILHDWGGAIGMGYAVRHPHTIGRIVVMNTAAFHLPATMNLPVALRLVRTPGIGPLAVRQLNAFALAAARFCCARRPLADRVRAGYLAPYDSAKNRIGVLRFVEDIPLASSDAAYPVISEIESGLHQFVGRPKLMLWGDRDFVFTPAVLDQWRRHWPDAAVQRFADCGHYVLEDAGQDAIGKIRDFLVQHPVS